MDDHAAPPRPDHSRRIRYLRSQGPLSPQDVALCRARDIALVYDPVQIGWLPADAIDDIDIEAEPLTFRRWTRADAARLAVMLSDPDLWRYLPEGWPGPLTREAALSLIDVANSAPHHRVRAVVVGGEVVGQMRVVLADGEVSYWLGSAHRGRGLARRALTLWLSHCRATVQGLSKVFVRIHQDNAASLRVARAAGFVDAGADAADPRFVILRQ